jgi:hypothetical protein
MSPRGGESRWAGDVHYYDQTPETIRREPNRDAPVVETKEESG